jgi:dihydrofolate synthase/folylpolyglutamate synthase
VNFTASLDYLYGLQRFGIKLGLENMQVIKSRMPLLQRRLPCIHVAGTNGKGSVSIMLAEILRHSGMRVGLYTSPHLYCFTERIRIDGKPVSQDEVALLAEKVRVAADGVPVTFFEAATAMALLAFQEHRVDIAVIETGLGGRLDATNIVEPQLCLVTPISRDHSEHLGETLAEIAAEKAGILKPGVPVVVGRQSPEALEVVLSAASSLDAQVCLAGRDFCCTGDHGNLLVVVGCESIRNLSCSLVGRHQQDNYAQAIAAAIKLREQGLPVTDVAIREAGRTVVWPGRLEWWACRQKILSDVSHNRAGIGCLADYLKELQIAKIHLVAGLSGKRAPEEVMMPLKNLVASVYAVPVCYGPGVPTSRIAAWAAGVALPCTEYFSAEAGLAAAVADCGEKSPVVICGSLYLVAELSQRFKEGALPFIN